METETKQITFGLSLADWSKLPVGQEWVKQRKARTHFVIRTRTVKLSDGSVHKYFVLRERPKNNRELIALQKEIEILKREVGRARIAATDRALLSAKNARNGVQPRRRKAKR